MQAGEAAPTPEDLFARAPDEVSIYEVSPRDGLQNESAQVATHAKVRLLEALIDCPQRCLGGDHEERHRHERRSQHDPRCRERQLDPEPVVQALTDQSGH